jgi:hypothetical protein
MSDFILSACICTVPKVDASASTSLFSPLLQILFAPTSRVFHHAQVAPVAFHALWCRGLHRCSFTPDAGPTVILASWCMNKKPRTMNFNYPIAIAAPGWIFNDLGN